MKIKKHIEIVRTDIRPLSSMSRVSALKIQAALSKYYETVGISTVNSLIDLEIIVRSNPDLVFLGLKRMEPLPIMDGSSKLWLADYLDEHGVSYTGSSSAAIQLDFDKASSKVLVAEAGVTTAAYFTTVPGQYNTAKLIPLSFPLFIKPLSTGGGTGVDATSVVRTFTEYQKKVSAIYESHQSASLVETYLDGREFSVAILDTYHGLPLLMPIEIITEPNNRGDRILGAQVKVEDHELVIGVSEKVVKDAVNAIALKAYQTLGGRDFARIDIRMDALGTPHFLEANFVPAPGTRYFAGACKINQDMDYETMLLKIVSLGLLRKPYVPKIYPAPLNKGAALETA